MADRTAMLRRELEQIQRNTALPEQALDVMRGSDPAGGGPGVERREKEHSECRPYGRREVRGRDTSTAAPAQASPAAQAQAALPAPPAGRGN